MLECLFESVNCDVLARIGMALLNQLMETTGLARNAGCSRDRAANTLTFSIHYFNMPYRLTAPNNSMESRAADSEVDLEEHVIIRLI
jgi:hypothetical protein